MKIDKTNYEAYFLDYHEGTLSAEQVDGLFLFLSQHPELQEEFETFENITLEDFSPPIFENKNSLKKNITADNCEDYFIKAVEGTLDTHELKLLAEFLEHYPSFEVELNTFKKTKLQANTTVVFKNKHQLKQAVNEDQFIAAMEGLLATEEQIAFDHQLAAHPSLQKTLAAYKQTKLVTDSALLFEDKASLKRKEKQVMPLFYYVAVAASIALLIGLFLMFETPERRNKTLATTNTSAVEKQKNRTQSQTAVSELPVHKNNPRASVSSASSSIASVKKQNKNKPIAPVILTEPIVSAHERETVFEKNSVVTSAPLEEKTFVEKPFILPLIDSCNPTPSVIEKAIVQSEKKPENIHSPSFSSVGEYLTGRIKERLVTNELLEGEKRTNTAGKITGWDIANLFAKGISKVIGKKVELKPTFNKQGNVSAYAFIAGTFEFSRGK